MAFYVFFNSSVNVSELKFCRCAHVSLVFSAPSTRLHTGTPCKTSGTWAHPTSPGQLDWRWLYHRWPRSAGSMVMFIEDILFSLLLAKAFFTFLLPHDKGLPLTPRGLIPISLKAPWEHCPQDQCHCRCLDSLQQHPCLVPDFSSSHYCC